MTKLKSYLCLLIFFLSFPSFAATPWTVDTFSNFEFSAAAGPNRIQTASTHLIVSPYETDSVLVNNISNQPFWKVGMGYHFFKDKLKQRSFFNDFLVELNVYRSLAKVSGDVWQYELPQFNNYTFNATFRSTRLMLDVKPALVTVQHISFHAILGVGNSWNNVTYDETVTGAGVPAISNYLLNTSSNSHVAFDVGIGLRGDFNDDISATVDYLYTSMGTMKSTTMSINNDPISSAPTFTMNNQGILFGLSWKI